MSDTSIISTASSDDYDNRKNTNYNDRSSFWNRHWFHIIVTLLLFIILIVSIILIYVLYKQAQRDRERRRIQNEFKQEYGLANKVLDFIRKDGIVAKWYKKNKGSTVTIFRELMTDMVETIFDQYCFAPYTLTVHNNRLRPPYISVYSVVNVRLRSCVFDLGKHYVLLKLHTVERYKVYQILI